MEIFSIFVFAGAIILYVTAIVSFLIKNENSSYFLYPTRSVFNVAWGLLFFIVYGKMVSKDIVSSFIFLTATIIISAYIIYLYFLKNFLEKEKSLLNPLFLKIINRKIKEQETLDKKFAGTYTELKALKVLGIAGYELNLSNIKEIMEKKYNTLKTFYDNKKIINPYFLTMIKKSYEALAK
ncbi:MAG: hypothetical protein LBR70_02390 [Lactobacillaceae bacterium]|jgi:uncharacterized membrane protein YbjE (DUF340 family)|nr:hypothetical protein [Lactobacillaceae bacterium]